MKKISSLLELIGNTPIKRLEKIGSEDQVNIWVKLECFNPSGSTKDRIALQMIEDAEQKGVLKEEHTIVESSSGNTAIALSFVGKLKGYKVLIFLPDAVAEEKYKIIEKYGAEFQLVNIGEKYSDSAMHGSQVEYPGRVMCRDMERENPNNVWWARQFSNPSNYIAQMKLGEEILNQMGKNIDAFVASIGTGGTIYGVSKILKKNIDNIKIVAVEPAGKSNAVRLTNFRIIPGLAGGILKDIIDSQLVNEVVTINDHDAIEMSRRLAKEEGLFVGVSSGANVLVALSIAKQIGKNSNVVTVLPDRGDRYITSEHYIT
jgi:cysteine synthase A